MTDMQNTQKNMTNMNPPLFYMQNYLKYLKILKICNLKTDLTAAGRPVLRLLQYDLYA